MAILFQTANFKSANTRFGGKPPNLMTANISGYTVNCSECMIHVLLHNIVAYNMSVP